MLNRLASPAWLLPRLVEICRTAGQGILDVYETSFSVEVKADRSPLTLADRRSHDIITRGLIEINENAFSIPILSEEGEDIPYRERNKWEYFWLVDPLDGTREFVNRNGEFTVNVALVHRSKPILGVIHVPTTGVTFFAAEDLGSFRIRASNWQKRIQDTDMPSKDISLQGRGGTIQGIQEAVRISDSEGVDKLIAAGDRLPLPISRTRFTVVSSRSHMSEETAKFIDKLRIQHKEIDFISAGSSLKFCLVAEGSADIYPRLAPTKEWDTAAGQAVVEQAGGRVFIKETSEPLSYNKENLLNPWFVAENRNSLNLDSRLNT